MIRMISGIIMLFSVLLLSYVLFMSSQSLIFIEAQNSTNIIQANYSNSEVYIPSTISKGCSRNTKKSTNEYVNVCNTKLR